MTDKQIPSLLISQGKHAMKTGEIPIVAIGSVREPDDLERRLREVGGFDPVAELCSEAADRIHKLELDLHFQKLQKVEWACYACIEKSESDAARIETLEKENTKLREEKLNLKVAAEKALRYSSDSDDWNKYGEGYGDLRKWVQKIARDTEND